MISSDSASAHESRRPQRRRGASGSRKPASASGRDGQPNGRVKARGRAKAAERRAHHEARRARLREARAQRTPHIEFPSDLPVSERRADIAEAIRENQVVVIAGETGSGKTTQIPKICLELGLGVDGLIGHTQPRRIAARSVAQRIADELGEDLGSTVGYQVRFTADVEDATRVKVMTDGILLSELRHDRLLRDYEVIIIDEAHERSLNIDFLIGLLAQILPQRPDLKVIITSATINPEAFSAHFDDAPIISVSGRTYPVEIRYRPLDPDEHPDEDDEYAAITGEDITRGGRARREAKDEIEGIIDAVDELSAEDPGDILVFLSGEREIRDAADALTDHVRSRRGPDWEIVPLFARLSAGEQQKVFQRHTRPRIVLATNVAETSLTVPGIKYVIDTGVARISRYSNRTKVQRLPIEPVSQASANQRSGRCGRTSDGICIRLYSQTDFSQRPEFTDPEILRTNLASVLLQMTALGFARTDAEIADFPFLTPPDRRAVRDGRALLGELQAMRTDEHGRNRLTETGRRIAALPIDPRLARMVVAGAEAGCGAEIAVIVAALSIQDPRERPAEAREEADALHARFQHPKSDFLAFLGLWNHLRDLSAELSSSKFRRTCRKEFLNYVRVREWQDLVGQLRALAKSAGLQLGEVTWRGVSADDLPAGRAKQQASAFDPHTASIHRALLAGLLSMIGQRIADSRDYQGARGARFAIFPGSGLFKKGPDFVMAAELVETSRLWARTVSWADPEWALELAGDLVSRTYSEPHWSMKAGQAMAYEKATLYGVTLVSDRRVGYGRIDAVHARELFIRHALIEGEWRDRHPFREKNEATIAEAEELASRTRDRRVLSGEDALYAFYDERIPADVLSASDFTGWWRKKRRGTPDFLDIPVSALLADDADDRTADLARDYPTHWPLTDDADGPRVELRYAFDPGAAGDGVTAEIRLEDLPDARPEMFTWQVPGLRAELVTALIRALPKAKRTYFVPAPDVAADVLASLDAAGEIGAGSLPEVLAAELTARAGGGRLEDRTPITVRASDFDLARLPSHLRMGFRILKGPKRIAEGADLAELQDRLRLERNRAAGVRPGGGAGAGSTAAADSGGQGAGRRRDPGRQSASAASGAGQEKAPPVPRRVLRDRVVDQSGDAVAYLRGTLSTSEQLVLTAHQKSRDDLLRSVLAVGATAELAAAGIGPDGVPEADAAGAVRAATANAPQRAEALLPFLVQALERATALDKLISKSSSLTILANLADVQQWRAEMTSPEAVAGLSEQALRRLPVWVEAAQVRVRRMVDAPPRDKQLMDRAQAAESSALKKLGNSRPECAEMTRAQRFSAVDADWHEVLFMLEELRLSLFADSLGTAVKVSEQRIAKAVAKL